MNFERYDDIQHLPLQVYNRVVFLHNLIEDSGKKAGEVYVESFAEGERRQMYLMAQYIAAKGPEFVQKEVTKGLKVVYDVADEGV
jgi:hypothetical protein